MWDNLARQEERREELIGGEGTAMSLRSIFNHNRVALNILFPELNIHVEDIFDGFI